MVVTGLLPFSVVIRDSKHSVDADAAVLVDKGNNVQVKEEMPQMRQRCDLLSSVPVVKLIETSIGMYMLDFGHSQGSFMSSFLAENAVVSKNNIRMYIDGKAWKHLISYAMLLGKNIQDESREYLRSELDDDASSICFSSDIEESVLLEDSVTDIIHTLLPLEKLFSWKVLVDSRSRGDLKWKDIRNLITQVREKLPLLSESGVLRNVVNVHLTFHQFISFARLLDNHLDTIANRLPSVIIKVVHVSTSTVDFELTSDYDCRVILAVMNDGQSCPGAAALKNQSDDMIVSQKNVNLKACTKTVVRIDSLNSDTHYNVYAHVEKCGSSVVSSDDDILKSRIVVVTDFSSNMFPSFLDMEPDEQRIELFSCVKDKRVRSKAQQSGIIAPSNANEFVSVQECSDSWSTFIHWWSFNQEVRIDFCSRELMFAAMDTDVRRGAEMSGISMGDRQSSDHMIRRRWKERFGAWYFGGMIVPDKVNREEIHSPFHTNIYTYNFSSGENAIGLTRRDEQIRLELPSFQNTVCRASSMMNYEEDNCSDERCGDTAIMNHLKIEEGPSKTDKDNDAPLSLDVSGCAIISSRSVSMIEALPTLDSSTFEQRLWKPTKTKIDNGATLEKERLPDAKAIIGPILNGPEIENEQKQSPESSKSNRHHFLRKINAKIDTAVTNLEKFSEGSKHRGIELFRSKVRLIILLQRIAPGAAVLTGSTESLDIFRQFDEKLYDFEALAAEHKKSRPVKQMKIDKGRNKGAELFKKASLFRAAKLSRKTFTNWFNWTEKSLLEKEEMKKKKSVADCACMNSLLSRIFRAFRSRANLQKKNRLAEDVTIPLELPNDSVPVEKEVIVAMEEEDLAVKFHIEAKQSSDRESKMFALEDIASGKFRAKCRQIAHFDSSIYDESDFDMSQAVTRRFSGVAVVCQGEYNLQLSCAIELKQKSSNSTEEKIHHFEPITKTTLRRMRREKLAGGRNIYDVPSEFTQCYRSDADLSTELRMREKIEGMLVSNH